MTHLLALLALSVPHLDQHGDVLPPGALARFGTVRFRVGSVRTRHSHALSPDGKLLAVEDRDGIALWDTETGHVKKRLPWRSSQADNPKFDLEFSSDGKRLARLAGRVVSLWDLANGKEVFDIDFKEQGRFEAFSWVPDKDQLIVTSEEHSRAWTLDAHTGKVVRTFEFEEKYSPLVPARQWIMGSIHADSYLLDLATGKEVASFPRAPNGNYEMNELSPNGKQVWSFTSDGGLRHFDAETGWKAKRLDTPPTWNGESKEFAMTFSSDGLFLYAMHSKGEVHRRDLKANKWLPPLTNVRQGTLMSNSNGTRLFVLGTDGVLGRYDLTTLKALPAPAGFEGALRSTASPDGKHLVIVAGKEVVRLQVLDAKGRLEWSDGPYDSGCSPCWVAVHSTKSAFSE